MGLKGEGVGPGQGWVQGGVVKRILFYLPVRAGQTRFRLVGYGRLGTWQVHGKGEAGFGACWSASQGSVAAGEHGHCVTITLPRYYSTHGLSVGIVC